MLCLTAPQWLLGIIAFDRLEGGRIGPQVGLGWLIVAWFACASSPGRAGVVLLMRRLLLPRLKPGRYQRNGWLASRIWFVERVSEVFRLNNLAGTPFAARYARLSGHQVGVGARLGSLPPVTSLVSIGENATIEADVDLHGWWLDGPELVIGELRIGAGARVGTRAQLIGGSEIGAGAEIEPLSLVNGIVPPFERWEGSPARRVGVAGESWPDGPAPAGRRPRFWKAMFAVGLALKPIIPLAAVAPALLIVSVFQPSHLSQTGLFGELLVTAPLIAASVVLSYAILVALLFRSVSRLLRPGWHPDEGAMGWLLWFSEGLMAGARSALFALFASVFTRGWLRLAGIRVGRRTELSTTVGLSPLISIGETSFGADEVVFATGRARSGWLHLRRISVGNGTFLGNGAILPGATALGDDSLVGVMTVAPRESADGSSWFGLPAIELPRVPDRPDPALTTNPSRKRVAARTCMDLSRILLPATLSTMLATLVLWALDAIGSSAGLSVMVAATPFVLLAAGLLATAVTVAAKWLIIGRYRSGQHPLWTFFVWRDEMINSLQEHLAGTWFLHTALGTPLMSAYLRAMGARVGRNVWFESMAITECDQVDLADDVTVNRSAVVQTHLFQDRLLRIGPAKLGAGSTLGPGCVVLPETILGEGCCVFGSSVVMRGESLPAHTRWHGAPVVAV